MEKVDTISEVKTKELPARDGQPPVTLYLIFDSAGNEFSTRDRDMAQVGHVAWQAGQHVHLDYDEKKGGQFGQFTNRYLNSITSVDTGPLGGGLANTATAALQQAQQAQAAASTPPGLFDDAVPEAPIGRLDSQSEKDLSIAKAVGLKAGVEVLQYLPAEERTVSNVVTAAEFFTTWLTTWRPQ